MGLEDKISRWFEGAADWQRPVRYREFLDGIGAKDYDCGRHALDALTALDKKRHAAGLPLFSVLIAFNGDPPRPLVNLLTELGLVHEGQPDEEIIEVIKQERIRTWLYYNPGMWE